MTQRYTRREAGRILGVEPSRLRYWERLRLVRPRARWGERFYSFGDLVALRTVKHLTECKIPARRVRLAVSLAEQQFGAAPRPLHEHTLLEHGREVLVVPPGTPMPFNPIRKQWVFPFEAPVPPSKVRSMVGRTPEQLFEMALDFESNPETLPEAIEVYERVVDLAPDWIEAHINLGVAYYQTGQISDACAAFRAAVELDPLNGISRYNLGCTLEELGEIDEAIEHLRRAARAMPAHADVHFNLALAHEKRGERSLAREQWLLYLRYAPGGPWAEQARARLKQYAIRRKRSAPIPFRQPR
ncbi:MAG TPA: tetratricopeptide repeat protein [Candidatus Solibacter sp.]|nr:tetratricopeptide repeat protein [Candidatus Solibacter sp.]